MASSFEDMQTTIKNQILLDASAVWTIDKKNPKKVATENKSEMQYLLNKDGIVVGKLQLKANSITRVVGKSSEFKKECALSLTLEIEKSIIMNDIGGWVNECLPHIKKLPASIKQNDSKIRLTIPKFKAIAMGVNHSFRAVLSSIVNDESILKDLYKVSQEYILSPDYNSVVTEDTILKDLCEVSQTNDSIATSNQNEREKKSKTLNNNQNSSLESVKEEGSEEDIDYKNEPNKFLLSLYRLRCKCSSVSSGNNRVANRKGMNS